MTQVKYEPSTTYLSSMGTTYLGGEACTGTGRMWYVTVDGKAVGDITEYHTHTCKKYLFMPNTPGYVPLSADSFAGCKHKLGVYATEYSRMVQLLDK